MFGKKDVLEKCMYCGEEVRFGGNPADYLHYSDEEIFGEKVVCPFCDGAITQVNRILSFAIKAKKEGNKQRVLFELENAKARLDSMMNSYSKTDL